MRLLGYALGILILIGCLYGVYQLPAVKVLFEPVEKKEDPLGFLRDLPEPEPREAPQRSRSSRNQSSSRAQSATARAPVEQEAVPENQVPNSEVGRVLIQILKARGLTDGISISVTDQEVLLYGTVDSQEDLNQIVDILNKARESRSVNVESVTVAEE